jgi:HD superfamily phosphodiesterase
VTKDKLREIKELVEKKTCNIKDFQHDCEHAKRVAKNALNIVQILGLNEKINLNLLEATCFLHDINYATFKPSLTNYFFEGNRTKKILPKILTGLGIKKDEKDIIENAIYNSSFSFPFRKLNKTKDLYSQLLQDADTIDFFSDERIKSFKKSQQKFFFYKLLSPLSSWAVRFGRKNLSKYLNFPKLAEYYYVSKN